MSRQGQQKQAECKETFQKQRVVVTVSGKSQEVNQAKAVGIPGALSQLCQEAEGGQPVGRMEDEEGKAGEWASLELDIQEEEEGAQR